MREETMKSFDEFRLTLVGGRALLGYTGETVEEGPSPVLGTLESSGLSTKETADFGWALVARWNAVTEALEVLDDTAGFGASTLDARAILRRAMEG
jgi:hypothetical protein